jgi:hypothetical protein
MTACVSLPVSDPLSIGHMSSVSELKAPATGVPLLFLFIMSLFFINFLSPSPCHCSCACACACHSTSLYSPLLLLLLELLFPLQLPLHLFIMLRLITSFLCLPHYSVSAMPAYCAVPVTDINAMFQQSVFFTVTFFTSNILYVLFSLPPSLCSP